ncbi:hypothetical protein JB92DRAFT_2829327 [Gautieria morchelliformis]|nr:hypothetical protein JB92DRAFT_2829327 [Gautieria morchelliformis]
MSARALLHLVITPSPMSAHILTFAFCYYHLSSHFCESTGIGVVNAQFPFPQISTALFCIQIKEQIWRWMMMCVGGLSGLRVASICVRPWRVVWGSEIIDQPPEPADPAGPAQLDYTLWQIYRAALPALAPTRGAPRTAVHAQGRALSTPAPESTWQSACIPNCTARYFPISQDTVHQAMCGLVNVSPRARGEIGSADEDEGAGDNRGRVRASGGSGRASGGMKDHWGL